MSGGGDSPMDRRLARTLVEASRAGRSGILTAMRGKLKRLFCMREGELVFATSNVIEEQLAELLVATGVLDEATHVAAAKASRRSGRPLAAELVEARVLDQVTLERTVALQIRRLLTDTLAWRDGEHAFKPGQPKLEGEPLAAVSPTAALIGYALGMRATGEELRQRMGRPTLKPIVAGESPELPPDVERDPVLDSLLANCDGTRSIGKLIAQSPGSADQTLRALYGLLLSEVLEPAEEAPKGRDTEAVTRDELIARLKRGADADCYGLLEQTVSATADDLRDAYYFLARRYHPDRFRTGPLSSYLPQVEEFFARVTEAYNTLSDAGRRATYDRERAAEVSESSSEPREEKQDAGYLAKENYARARVLIQRGRYADSLQFLENAVQLDDRQALYYLELGRVKGRNPRMRDEALRHLARANELDPARVDAYIERGRLYTKAGELALAAEMYQETLRWEPGNLEATEALAELKRAGGSNVLRGLFRE